MFRMGKGRKIRPPSRVAAYRALEGLGSGWHTSGDIVDEWERMFPNPPGPNAHQTAHSQLNRLWGRGHVRKAQAKRAGAWGHRKTYWALKAEDTTSKGEKA